MNILKSGFTKNSLYSMTGFGIVVLTSFLFNAFLARKLGAEEFGVYLAYFYLLQVFLQPINSLQLAVAKYSAEKKLGINESINDITTTLLIIGFLLFAVFTLISPFLINFYHLKNIFQVLVGGGVIVTWLILNGYRGPYLGKQDFFTYAANMGIEGVARLIFGLLFILMGFHIKGAIGASIASGLAGIIILIEGKFNFLIHHIHLKNWKINRTIIGEFFKACIVFLPFGLIASLDLGMVQYVIGGKIAGYISICGQFKGNLIALSLVLANVSFTYTIKHKDKTFWYSIIFTAVIFAAFGLFTLFAGEWLIKIVGGKDFKPALEYFTIYIFASLPLGIMQNIVTYSIAKNINLIKISIWVVLIILALIFYFSLKITTIIGFLWIMMISGILIDLVLFFFLWKFNKQAA